MIYSKQISLPLTPAVTKPPLAVQSNQNGHPGTKPQRKQKQRMRETQRPTRKEHHNAREIAQLQNMAHKVPVTQSKK